MGEPDGSIEFYEPNMRAMFDINGIRVNKTLEKILRKGNYEVRFDTCFRRVVRACIRPPEQGNWINEEIIRAYTEFHKEGWAHSCEIFIDEELVGGAYGVAIGAAFMGESMFHRVSSMSRVATYHLVEKCRELGFEFVDAQMPNDQLTKIGAYSMTQEDYLPWLHRAVRKSTPWSPIRDQG